MIKSEECGRQAKVREALFLLHTPIVGHSCELVAKKGSLRGAGSNRKILGSCDAYT